MIDATTEIRSDEHHTGGEPYRIVTAGRTRSSVFTFDPHDRLGPGFQLR